MGLLAQNKTIDSLETVLKSADNEQKAQILAKLASLYSKEPEKRFSYAQQALKLSKEYNNPRAKSLALYSLSLYYLDKNKLSKSMEFADSCLDAALIALDSSLITKAYYVHAINYFHQADYNNAALAYKQAINYCPSTDKSFKYFLLQNYAIALYNLSNYQASLKILLDIIGYYENEADEYESVSHIYNIIGSIFVEMADTISGISYYNKALKMAPLLDTNSLSTETFLNLGVLYYDKKMLDSAKHYFLTTLKRVKKDTLYSIVIGDTYTALGNLYLDINKNDSALYYYRKVIELSEKANDAWAQVYGYIGLAKIYNKEQNYGKALYYLYKAEPLAQKVNANELLRDFYKIFSETLALSGSYREAYQYMKLYNRYSDKSYKEKSTHELTNLKVAYETEKKEQENKRLLSENKFKEQNIKNQYYINISIALLLLVSLIFAVSFFRDKKKIQKAHKLLVEKNSEILSQNEEIKLKSEEVSKAYLKLRELDEYRHGLTNMIIHDLKNPLNIILNMAENILVREAANKMFHLVSDILDVSKLEEAKMVLNKEHVLLKEIVQDAIDKTKFSAGVSEIEVIDNVQDNLTVYADKDLTERILINLLSNAIKFSPQKSKIFINSEIEDQQVRISVKDFGIGIPAEEQNQIFDKFVQFKAVHSGTVRSTGLGLTFCKLAIEAQGGNIGVESSVNSGSVFWFKLPLAK